ncbi:MAG: hypothetical protein AM1032_000054 [Mycoplasmataceae bacterium]|nr:MAG: hypothetical protein AM1032_000054 [Mycoplasmataceae bacterium]
MAKFDKRKMWKLIFIKFPIFAVIFDFISIIDNSSIFFFLNNKFSNSRFVSTINRKSEIIFNSIYIKNLFGRGLDFNFLKIISYLIVFITSYIFVYLLSIFVFKLRKLIIKLNLKNKSLKFINLFFSLLIFFILLYGNLLILNFLTSNIFKTNLLSIDKEVISFIFLFFITLYSIFTSCEYFKEIKIQ